MSFVDNVLSHYGTKGMRWGVRKDRGGVTLLGRRRIAKPTPSEDKLKAEAARAKVGRRGNTDSLSNDELRTLLNRMNLEQNISKALTGQQNKTVKSFITRKLTEATVSEFKTFARGEQTRVIGKVLGDPGGRHRKIKK